MQQYHYILANSIEVSRLAHSQYSISQGVLGKEIVGRMEEKYPGCLSLISFQRSNPGKSRAAERRSPSGMLRYVEALSMNHVAHVQFPLFRKW